MSDRRPPTSSNPPNASAYAVMTHWRSGVEKPSARWAEGSAMFTMVASSTTMSWAIPMTARISQRRGSWPPGSGTAAWLTTGPDGTGVLRGMVNLLG
ncbi:MAG TPA: hypothetical protein VGI00_25255 [Streptosporangiaceae bacterium]